MRHRTLTYIGIALLVCAFAAAEFVVEFFHGDAPDAALCLTPESKRDAIKEVLLHHMRGH
jgi:hypothetical protein